jgi:CubicO group peptidase (beta-lactamase class C family)
MQRHIFAPLDIDASYLASGLSDLAFNQLATLYTKQDPQGVWDSGGPWYPQADDYGGRRPYPQPPQPLAASLPPRAPAAAPSAVSLPPSYVPGVNATRFSPHGGLRISAHDLAKLLLVFLDEGEYAGVRLLRPATVRQMLTAAWRFDSQAWNGDTSGGRYTAWGLGLQLISPPAAPAAASRFMLWGHRGEAYGFAGGIWFDPNRSVGFVYLIGGTGADPYLHPGTGSPLPFWEEAIQTAVLGALNRRETIP